MTPSRLYGLLPTGLLPTTHRMRLVTGLIGGCAVLLLSIVFSGGAPNPSLTNDLSSFHFTNPDADTTVRPINYTTLPARPVLRDLSSHPADRLAPYLNPSADPSSVANPDVLRDFHDLLAQFTRRQAQDDNFTVRVIDRRTHDLLELYELEDLRTRYRQGRSIDWRAVDEKRRDATRRLVDKYVERGVPREDITVRWGRANQIEEARRRGQPYQAYEIQLAHYLDLSLLPTQMGTVETFNQDDLVSSVGARSRYQMMPWILRKSGVNEYDLQTESGRRVEVEEALHPLLTLEPAFLLLRGYINAVGHEIPGLSAYHAGPGNIYKLYRQYYTASSHYTPDATVVDAYIWAVSTGFDTVRENSSFGPFSRGYIPSAYGALAAQDRTTMDLSQSMQGVRAQLKPDAEASLKTILTVLDTTARSFDWAPANDRPTTYERFRAFNRHFDLPESSGEGVPTAGNVRLSSTLNGKSVRFFLPLGAPEALRAAGLDIIDPRLSLTFDGSTYTPPSEDQKTVWDRRYDALVDDIQHFGFTPSNRDRLLELHDKFVELAEKTPSRYRRRQLDIIKTHRRLWRSAPWEELSELTMQVTGRTEAPVHPPVEVPAGTTKSPFQRLIP